ncbi:MAG: MBL fold metallo-hydrolase [Bacteroidales bacterium]
MSTDILSFRLGITNTYLLRGTKGIVMIDAGNPGKIKAFKRSLSKLYILPGDIKLIILTHSHFDHAGSAKEIQEFTGANLLMHESEKRALEEGRFFIPEGVTTWGKISAALFLPFVKRISFPLPRIDIVTGDEDFLLTGFGIDGTVVHTPGHTQGSISVLLRTGEAFVGCMAHAGFPFRSVPGLPIYAQNISMLKGSWKKIIAKGARVIFPAHGKPFPLDLIRKKIENNPLS